MLIAHDEFMCEEALLAAYNTKLRNTVGYNSDDKTNKRAFIIYDGGPLAFIAGDKQDICARHTPPDQQCSSRQEKY